VSGGESADVVRRGFDAFVTRDFDTVRRVIAEDVVWRIPGASVLAGEHRGLDAALAMLRRSLELSGGTYTTELVDLYGSETGAVARYRARGRRDDRELDVEQALFCRVDGGRIVEVDAVPFDQRAFDAFWS
jgi:hypothetical protein